MRTVTVKANAKSLIRLLHRFIQGQQSGDNAVLTAITVRRHLYKFL